MTLSGSRPINNCPDYAKHYKYIVARDVDGEIWFYGAWNDEKEANRVAKELGENAMVLDNEDYEEEEE